jgi:hypothetical protein
MPTIERRNDALARRAAFFARAAELARSAHPECPRIEAQATALLADAEANAQLLSQVGANDDGEDQMHLTAAIDAWNAASRPASVLGRGLRSHHCPFVPAYSAP